MARAGVQGVGWLLAVNTVLSQRMAIYSLPTSAIDFGALMQHTSVCTCWLPPALQDTAVVSRGANLAPWAVELSLAYACMLLAVVASGGRVSDIWSCVTVHGTVSLNCTQQEHHYTVPMEGLGPSARTPSMRTTPACMQISRMHALVGLVGECCLPRDA